MSSIQERVQRGADLLDREIPGWERLVDVDALALESSCRCVLGQVGAAATADRPKNDRADYCAMVTALYRAGSLGIRYDTFDCGFNGILDYPSLTRAWKKLIRERQSA